MVTTFNTIKARRQSLNGAWQAAPAADEFPPRADWRAIRVPANWHVAGFPDYAGALVYRRSFSAPTREADERVFLCFAGVDYFAEVWLNGVSLGRHEGYFAPFEFDITPHLQTENDLVVRVESPREPEGDIWPNAKQLIKGIFNHHDCRPGGVDPVRGQDGNTGGIWSDVTLEVRPANFLRGLRCAAILLPDGAARLSVAAEARFASTGNVTLHLAVTPANFDSAERHEIRATVTSAPGEASFPLVLTLPHPRLWWPWDQGEQPLYWAEVTLLLDGAPVDSRRERIGIRQIEITPDWEWRLNGRRMFPRGTNLLPAQWLSEYTPERIGQDVRLLREANVNAIRIHAHVNRDELYDACDEAGILVWQDFALQWGYAGSDDFAARASAQLGEMIRRLYNHPSLVVWCCHNEPNADNLDDLDPLLHQVARAADPSRFVEPASDFRSHSYPGWYYSHYYEFAGLPSAPCVTEFGAQALPGVDSLREMFPPEKLWPPDWSAWAYHNFQHDQTFNVAGIQLGASLEEFVTNSQAYQARLLQYAIEHYRKARFRPVTGLFHFMFVDAWPAITYSVVDYWRRPKAGYAALQRAYQPVLVVIHHPRQVEQCGATIEVFVSVVNDLPRAFPGARLRLWLADSAGRIVAERQVVFDLPPDSVVDLTRDSDFQGKAWQLPPDGPLGSYRLCAELTAADLTPISFNEQIFDVVAKPV
jgi:beta-mannosidase